MKLNLRTEHNLANDNVGHMLLKEYEDCTGIMFVLLAGVV